MDNAIAGQHRGLGLDNSTFRHLGGPIPVLHSLGSPGLMRQDVICRWVSESAIHRMDEH